MIDKPDPAKDAGRTDGPGVKRPHATLDLKATEVRPPQQTPGAISSASSSSSAASGSSTASGTPPSEATSAGSASAGPNTGANAGVGTGAQPAAKSAASASSTEAPKSAAGPAAAKAAVPRSPVEPKPQASGAGGGFISHLVAGILGGCLVYGSTGFLWPALTGSPPPEASAGLEARIAALETAPKTTADISVLTSKIGDAEARLAKLDQLEQSVTALRDAQSTLQAETQALNEASQKSDSGTSAERVAKLEQQLALIAAAAPGPDGRIPQLAALTGKISDLESSLATQIGALRKSLPSEIEDRLNTTAETSEAARSAATRLDRDVSQVRTDQARVAQRLETAKADSDRFGAALEAVKEETGRLSSAVGDLKASVDAQLKSVAKPADVSAAVAPVASKVAELQQNVDSVVKSEQSRKENAERIVLSLELANLKRALDRGQGYAAELDEVRRSSGGRLDLTTLERFKTTGVPTLAVLKDAFRPVMNAVIDADTDPADGSVIDRLLAGAKSVVRVRKISHEAGDQSAEAVVGRIDQALGAGDLGEVIDQAKQLPDRARAPIEDWLRQVTARHSVDVATASVEDQLKASLSGATEVPPKPPATQPN